MKLRHSDRRNGGYRTRRDAIACSANGGFVWRGTSVPGSTSDRLLKEETAQERQFAESLNDTGDILFDVRPGHEEMSSESINGYSCYDEGEMITAACGPICPAAKKTSQSELSN